jgi:hypothetical protein
MFLEVKNVKCEWRVRKERKRFVEDERERGGEIILTRLNVCVTERE